MSVVVNKTEGRYVVANRAIVEDKTLSMKDRGLLFTLISLPPLWNFTVSGIASILPDGYGAVSACMNRLIEAGYVRRVQGRSEGKFSDVQLEVYDSPIDRKPQTENPITENTIAGNSVTENEQQLNTNKSKTKGCATSTDRVKSYGRKKQSGDGTVHGWSDAEKDLYGI